MRHRTLALIAIAALAAAWCVDGASQESIQRAPARVACTSDGKVVGITVLIPEPGVFVLHLPPDVCDRQNTTPPPPAQPQPAASSSRHTTV